MLCVLLFFTMAEAAVQRTSPLCTCSDYAREYIALLPGAVATTRLQHVALHVQTADCCGLMFFACREMGVGHECPVHGLVYVAPFDTKRSNKQCPFAVGLVLLRLRLAAQYSVRRVLMPGAYSTGLHLLVFVYDFRWLNSLSAVFHLLCEPTAHSHQPPLFRLHTGHRVAAREDCHSRDLQSAASVQSMGNLNSHITKGLAG